MSWIDDNKGAGPWQFSKTMADENYNEGDRITTLGNPVWSMFQTGIPITATHAPCGVWNRRLVPNVLPPINPVLVDPGGLPIINNVVWHPKIGAGRFLGLYTNLGYSYFTYSNNDGVTWTSYYQAADNVFPQSAQPQVLSSTIAYGDYDGGVYIVGYRDGVGVAKVGIAISYDGVNWIKGPLGQFNSYPTKIIYVKDVGLFFITTAVGGGRSYMYTSADGLNVVASYPLALYSDYSGLAYLNGYVYAISANYTFQHRFNASNPADYTDSFSPNFHTYCSSNSWRQDAIAGEGRIIYAGGYAVGSTLVPNNQQATALDYSPTSRLFACVDRYTNSGRDAIFSYDGLDWKLIYTGRQMFDVAIGLEYAVFAINSAPLILIKVV